MSHKMKNIVNGSGVSNFYIEFNGDIYTTWGFFIEKCAKHCTVLREFGGKLDSLKTTYEV